MWSKLLSTRMGERMWNSNKDSRLSGRTTWSFDTVFSAKALEQPHTSSVSERAILLLGFFQGSSEKSKPPTACHVAFQYETIETMANRKRKRKRDTGNSRTKRAAYRRLPCSVRLVYYSHRTTEDDVASMKVLNGRISPRILG